MADQNGFQAPPGTQLASDPNNQNQNGGQASNGFVPPAGTSVVGAPSYTPESAATGNGGDLDPATANGQGGDPISGGVATGVARTVAPIIHAIEHPIDTVIGVAKNSPPGQLYESTKQMVPVINAYEKSRASGASIGDSLKAADVQARSQDNTKQVVQQAVDAFKKNPTQETIAALTQATLMAATIWGGGAAAEGAEAGTAADVDAAATATPEATDTEAASTAPTSTPSLIQKGKNLFNDVVKTPTTAGEEASSEAAQSAIQEQVPGQGEGISLRKGIDTETPYAEAKKLYGQVDDAAKTDFKGLYDKLDAAQDDAREAAIGSPEEAKAQLNIKNTQDAITDAKQKAAESGVPDVDKVLDQADAKFQETQANKDFNKMLQSKIKGNIAHGAPEKIDVDSTIDGLEKMDAPNKYGQSRLQQTSLGKDGAFKLKQALYDAQKAGKAAVTRRYIINTIGTTLASALGLGVVKKVAGVVSGDH